MTLGQWGRPLGWPWDLPWGSLLGWRTDLPSGSKRHSSPARAIAHSAPCRS